MSPREAHNLHPIFPVTINGIVFKAPKLAPLTNIVISMPEIPLTGKLLTKMEIIKNLNISSAWLKKYMMQMGKMSVGNTITMKVAKHSFIIMKVKNDLRMPNSSIF